jgi:hypothetical protein
MFAISLQAVLAVLLTRSFVLLVDKRRDLELDLGEGPCHQLRVIRRCYRQPTSIIPSSYPDGEDFFCIGHEACANIATCDYTPCAES